MAMGATKPNCLSCRSGSHEHSGSDVCKQRYQLVLHAHELSLAETRRMSLRESAQLLGEIHAQVHLHGLEALGSQPQQGILRMLPVATSMPPAQS